MNSIEVSDSCIRSMTSMQLTGIKQMDGFDWLYSHPYFHSIIVHKDTGFGINLQENIPAMIPVEMCYLGWQESLEKLAKLVEPDIPDM